MKNQVKVSESNPIEMFAHLRPDSGAELVDWTDRRLARITRLRLLTDRGFPFWDVSYVWGQLHDGTLVNVQVPFSQLHKANMRADIIRWAKRDGVYAKGLGVFGAISCLWG